MSLGKRIKELRVDKKYSQEELGRLAGGIPSATISRYENDLIDSPRIPILLAIAAALKANPQYLIDGKPPKLITELSGGMIELNEVCADLSPEALAMIIAAAKSLKNMTSF